MVIFNPHDCPPEAVAYIAELQMVLLRVGKELRRSRDIIECLEIENREYLNAVMLMNDVIEEQERVLQLARDGF